MYSTLHDQTDSTTETLQQINYQDIETDLRLLINIMQKYK